MRLDDFLSTVGVIKRRTIAKEMATNGLVQVGSRRVKAAYEVHVGDIIMIRGSHPMTVEVLAIPGGSVPKERRLEYYRPLSGEGLKSPTP
jgi:ribosomal 50S subunit-recycling heat shock protein